MEKWVCVQGSLGLWEGSRSEKNRDTELLRIRTLNSAPVFHIIIMVSSLSNSKDRPCFS